MALRGTLEDINIVDLVQYPHTGRRTGEMVIAGQEDEARLYYQAGALVHGEVDDLEGLDVLVRLMDWTVGEFEFRGGVEAKRTTLKGDLHHLVMRALKVRDERRQAEEQRSAEEAELRRLQAEFGANAAADPALFKRLATFVADNALIRHACVLGEDGSVVVEASAKGRRPSDLDELRESLLGLYKAYPRPTPTRLCVEDEEGTVVVSDLDGYGRLLTVAKAQAPMGAVTMMIKKLATVLAEATRQ